MAHFPEWIDRTEAAIINKFLTRVLGSGDGLSARVWDGEEWATGWTCDRAEIQRQTAATDHTVIHVRNDRGAAVGAVVFIHGNGEDVLSDYSWPGNVPGAEARIDALCAGLDA